MEAKDTVMTGGDLCLLVCAKYRKEKGEGKPCDGLDCEKCQLENQAEISFQKGMQKVVDWVKENSCTFELMKDRCFGEEDWQSFLKEHGLK